jgi:hypothetical protein
MVCEPHFQRQGEFNETHNRISFADARIHPRGLWPGGNVEGRVQRKLLPGRLREMLY